MKQLKIVTLFLILSLSLNAQTKITKSNIIGKWAISAIEMAGKFYYNIDTDSLNLGQELKAQSGDEAQMNLVIAMVKQQLGVLTKMTLQFNADGTAILVDGTELTTDAEKKSKATYIVDESNSSITTKDSDNKENTMKVDIMDGKLRIKQTQPEGEFILSLKKVTI